MSGCYFSAARAKRAKTCAIHLANSTLPPTAGIDFAETNRDQNKVCSACGAHIRKVVLGHSMAAFLFNMGILAFTVNALGGL